MQIRCELNAQFVWEVVIKVDKQILKKDRKYKERYRVISIDIMVYTIHIKIDR